MYKNIFCKDLPELGVEQELLSEVLDAGDKIWWTAKNNSDGSLTFVKDKPSGGFYLSRLKRFPNAVKSILDFYPDAIIENSYFTKCLPNYTMIPHIDPGRHTAIIVPLGSNMGRISFYYKDFKLYTHTYKGPTLTRVNILHSAENTSNVPRYALTIEVPGSYFRNYISR
jgi:hypothetical protein